MTLAEAKTDKRKEYKKIAIHCALIFVALFLILRFVKEKSIDDSQKAYACQNIAETGDYGGLHQLSEANSPLVQKFEATTDTLKGLGLSFATHFRGEKGALEVIVLDEQGKTVAHEVMSINLIGHERYNWLIFGRVEKHSRGKEYELSLSVKGMDEGSSLGVIVNQNLATTTGTLSDANGVITGNIKVEQIYAQTPYLKNAFYMFAAMVVILIYGVYFGVFVVKLSKEHSFLSTMILVGLAYALLIKPGGIPDEPQHYQTVYAYSNALMGKSHSADKTIMMAKKDYEFHKMLQDPEPTSDSLKNLLEQFGGRQESGEMLDSQHYAIQAPFYLYIPQILGMTLGRIIGFNSLTCFYLGRIFNVLLFALIAFITMKKLPFYKMSMFVICLFPMTAQLIGSFSYDSAIIATALILFAYIVALLAKESDSTNTKELAVIAISAILLAGCKSGAYIPLFGLLFLIPQKHFKKRSHQIMFWGVTLLGMILMFSLMSISAISWSFGEARVSWAGQPPYTLGWIFSNPLDFIQLLSSTLYDNGDHIITSIFGWELAWFNMPIHKVTMMGFAIILLFTGIQVEGEPTKMILVRKQKSKIIISCILSVAIIVAAIMLTWTPLGYYKIEGVQGRYFIPLLLPLVACLKDNKLIARKAYDRGLIFTVAWLQVAALICIFIITVLATG